MGTVILPSYFISSPIYKPCEHLCCHSQQKYKWPCIGGWDGKSSCGDGYHFYVSFVDGEAGLDGACFRSNSWWPLPMDGRYFWGKSRRRSLGEVVLADEGKRNELKAVDARLAGSLLALVGVCGFMGY